MGPSQNDSVALLLEKDQEISRLKLQLKAHAARTSLIHSRLLVTQNALDALQVTHDEELKAEQNTNTRLRQKLNTYYEYVKSVKEQKDDLRDAIVSFLRRESHHASVVQDPHNVWPQSQIHVSNLVDDPLPPKLHRNQDISSKIDHDLMVYAASMIEALVQQRDSYMEAHRLLSQKAKAQIAALEAELAHRDYELEQYISHCSDCPSLARALKTRTKLEPLPVMDSATLVKVIQRTSSRHKTLELGNKQLERRLEELRPTAVIVGPPQPEDDEEPDDKKLEEAENLDDSDNTIRITAIPNAIQRSPRGTEQLLTQMDREIKELGLEVQAFTSERDLLQRMIAEQAKDHSDSDSHKDQSSNTRSQQLSPEPSGTVNRPIEQRELTASYEASLQREKALIEENLKLVGIMRQSHASNAPDDKNWEPPSSSLVLRAEREPSTSPSPSRRPGLLDVDDGEISMELATPLLPTTFISPEKSCPPSRSSSPRRFFPVSPVQLQSSLFGEAPYSLQFGPSSTPQMVNSGLGLEEVRPEERGLEMDDHPISTELERLASELNSAGQQVAKSEKAVNELANLMIDLERTNFKSS